MARMSHIRTCRRAIAAISGFPQSLEAPAGGAGVMDRMTRVAVSEVVLDQAQVMALVGQIVAAAMAQHVRPDIAKSGARSRPWPIR